MRKVEVGDRFGSVTVVDVRSTTARGYRRLELVCDEGHSFVRGVSHLLRRYREYRKLCPDCGPRRRREPPWAFRREWFLDRVRISWKKIGSLYSNSFAERFEAEFMEDLERKMGPRSFAFVGPVPEVMEPAGPEERFPQRTKEEDELVQDALKAWQALRDAGEPCDPLDFPDLGIEMSLAEIGRVFGLSRERIRQMEAAAFKTLEVRWQQLVEADPDERRRQVEVAERRALEFPPAPAAVIDEAIIRAKQRAEEPPPPISPRQRQRELRAERQALRERRQREVQRLLRRVGATHEGIVRAFGMVFPAKLAPARSA